MVYAVLIFALAIFTDIDAMENNLQELSQQTKNKQNTSVFDNPKMQRKIKRYYELMEIRQKKFLEECKSRQPGTGNGVMFERYRPIVFQEKLNVGLVNNECKLLCAEKNLGDIKNKPGVRWHPKRKFYIEIGAKNHLIGFSPKGHKLFSINCCPELVANNKKVNLGNLVDDLLAIYYDSADCKDQSFGKIINVIYGKNQTFFQQESLDDMQISPCGRLIATASVHEKTMSLPSVDGEVSVVIRQEPKIWLRDINGKLINIFSIYDEDLNYVKTDKLALVWQNDLLHVRYPAIKRWTFSSEALFAFKTCKITADTPQFKKKETWFN